MATTKPDRQAAPRRDQLHAVATEANEGPVFETAIAGRRFAFGQPDLRPSRLRRLASLGDRLIASEAATSGPDGSDIGYREALEVTGLMEDMLRSALPTPEDRAAFDDADMTGTELAEVARGYFDALGVDVGESSASPGSSPSTRSRSRQTSKRSTRSR